MDKNTQQVKIKFLDNKAKLPERKSEEAAAFDLYALEDTELIPFEVNKVRTGLSIEVPKGFKGEVYTRSGYGAKGIFIANQPGKIDSDYRGEIFCLLLYIPQDFGWLFNDLKNSLITFAKDGSSNAACINLISSLQNIKMPTYKIKAGDRIAQFEIQEVINTEFVPADKLTETIRGSCGMGSTGK